MIQTGLESLYVISVILADALLRCCRCWVCNMLACHAITDYFFFVFGFLRFLYVVSRWQGPC